MKDIIIILIIAGVYLFGIFLVYSFAWHNWVEEKIVYSPLTPAIGTPTRVETDIDEPLSIEKMDRLYFEEEFRRDIYELLSTWTYYDWYDEIEPHGTRLVSPDGRFVVGYYANVWVNRIDYNLTSAGEPVFEHFEDWQKEITTQEIEKIFDEKRQAERSEELKKSETNFNSLIK